MLSVKCKKLSLKPVIAKHTISGKARLFLRKEASLRLWIFGFSFSEKKSKKRV